MDIPTKLDGIRSSRLGSPVAEKSNGCMTTSKSAATPQFLFSAARGINPLRVRYSLLRETKTATGQSRWMTRRPASREMGALAGMGVTSLHHVHHAVSNQIPDNIVAHVLSESAMGAAAGGTFPAAVTVLVNRFRRHKEIR
jgi:hypothetical protein